MGVAGYIVEGGGDAVDWRVVLCTLSRYPRLAVGNLMSWEVGGSMG